MNKSKSYAGLLVAITLLIMTSDYLSKAWVHSHLPLMGYAFPDYPYGGIPVFQNLWGVEFSISHMTNYGAAWGVFGEYQHFLLFARIFMITGMFIYLLFFNHDKEWSFPLILVIAGAIGNVIDYFNYGHVVDMLHFVLWGYDFPVFNIADSAVTVGVIWMLALSLLQEIRCRRAI